MEKAPTRAFSWLKAATTAFTFKTLLRHYAKRALTPRSLNVKLGPRRNYHKGRAAIRHYKSWEVGCGNTEDDACCDVSTGGNHDSSGGGGCCTDTDGCGNTSVVATPPSVWVSTDLLARPPVILSGTSRCLNWTEHSHSHFSVHFSYFNLSN